MVLNSYFLNQLNFPSLFHLYLFFNFYFFH
nr:MAG TPA: hypothetical protein [Caudoviricetes sp.]